MIAESLGDVAMIGSLAAAGPFMTPLPLRIIGALDGATIVLTWAMDSIKQAVFARVRLD